MIMSREDIQKIFDQLTDTHEFEEKIKNIVSGLKHAEDDIKPIDEYVGKFIDTNKIISNGETTAQTLDKISRYGIGAGNNYVELEYVYVDHNNGLEWQEECPGETMTFYKAKSYCENLVYAGHNDWRLPTIKELLTIVDYEKYDPACVINNCKNKLYWSCNASVNCENSNDFWAVDFRFGFVHILHRANQLYVRAVRTIKKY